MGNELFGAFGPDFATSDGERLMIVAITRRQWTGLLAVLRLEAEIAALEGELGVSFADDEGVRFEHRERLNPLIAGEIACRTAAELVPAFEQRSVCWGRYQSLHQALQHDKQLGTANPLFVEVDHASGRYPTPGAAATIPDATRRKPAPAPVLGADTEQVLAEILGLPGGEIGRLHDSGLVAGPPRMDSAQ